MRTKNDIRIAFCQLRRKNFTVKVFQTDRIKRRQESDIPDILMIYPSGFLFFIEIKVDDKLSEGQISFRNIVTEAMISSKNIFYLLATPGNTVNIVNFLFTKKFDELRNFIYEDPENKIPLSKVKDQVNLKPEDLIKFYYIPPAQNKQIINNVIKPAVISENEPVNSSQDSKSQSKAVNIPPKQGNTVKTRLNKKSKNKKNKK